MESANNGASTSPKFNFLCQVWVDYKNRWLHGCELKERYRVLQHTRSDWWSKKRRNTENRWADTDYYAVLGLQRESANSEAVDSSYKQLAMRHHPDKQKGTRTGNMQDLVDARDALNSDCTRLYYNLITGTTPPSHTNYEELLETRLSEMSHHAQQLAQSHREKQNNTDHAPHHNTDAQRTTVVKADYGLLHVDWSCAPVHHLFAFRRLRSKFVVDVTSQLQAYLDDPYQEGFFLDKHSKVDQLSRVFDPAEVPILMGLVSAEDAIVELEVEYEFQGRRHRARVHDFQCLRIPDEAHAVGQTRAPVDDAYASLMDQRQQRRAKRKQDKRDGLPSWQRSAMILLGTAAVISLVLRPLSSARRSTTSRMQTVAT